MNSARHVAAVLRLLGARFGVVLVSDKHHAVTKADMQAAIVELKSRIRADGAAHPLIVFYYMGHGMGDTFGQALYLPPGDVTWNSLPSQSASSVLGRKTLSNFDVIASLEVFRLPKVMSLYDNFFESDVFADWTDPSDILRAASELRALIASDDRNRAAGLYPPGRIPPVPFIALFDNCYDAVLQNLASPRGLPPTSFRNHPVLKHVLDALVALARQHIINDLGGAQSDGLVMYAEKPGNSVTEYEDPSEHDPKPVGSLARRLLLALPAASGSTMTLRQFRDAMDDPRASTFGAATAAHAVDSPTPFYLRAADEMTLDSVEIPSKRLAHPDGEIEYHLGTGTIMLP